MQTNDMGYGIVAECLSNHECDELEEALAAKPLNRSRAGARHLMSVPAVAALANDSRLTEIARRWLGDSVIPFRATLFDKSNATNWLIPWHQDTALPLKESFDEEGWGPWSEKAGVIYAHAPAWALSRVIALRIHLDESNSDNGPLRVIPCSHLAGILTDPSVMEVASKDD